jgi:hypothetical protein
MKMVGHKTESIYRRYVGLLEAKSGELAHDLDHLDLFSPAPVSITVNSSFSTAGRNSGLEGVRKRRRSS